MLDIRCQKCDSAVGQFDKRCPGCGAYRSMQQRGFEGASARMAGKSAGGRASTALQLVPAFIVLAIFGGILLLLF